uniref:hypothetical protein n=1 Tax=Nitrospira cf. moscoviensis SBR1015 TaxID=96242 RepID=UPI00117FB333|nr:hypothetical protein [Nitrospira cf. moscoviensis SBR1015]
MAEHAGERIGPVPFAQFDPPVRPVGEKILVRIERQVLLVEIGFQMEHMAHSHQTGIVGPGGKRTIRREGAGEEIAGKERFFDFSTIGIIHGGERTSVLFQGRCLWDIDHEEDQSEAQAEGRRGTDSEGNHGVP